MKQVVRLFFQMLIFFQIHTMRPVIFPDIFIIIATCFIEEQIETAMFWIDKQPWHTLVCKYSGLAAFLYMLASVFL